MAEENATPKPKPSAESLQIRKKAKEAAKAEGKDWAALSKHDRLAYKKTVGGDIAKEAKRGAKKALKAEKANAN